MHADPDALHTHKKRVCLPFYNLNNIFSISSHRPGCGACAHSPVDTTSASHPGDPGSKPVRVPPILYTEKLKHYLGSEVAGCDLIVGLITSYLNYDCEI